MSAIPVVTSDLIAQPPPRGVQWLDIATAAQRSGKSEGHLGRRCRAEWSRTSPPLAKIERPPEGGKPCWYIREDADPAICRVKTIEQLNCEFALNRLPDRQVELLLRKERTVLDWQALKSRTPRGEWNEATDLFVAQLAAAGF